MWFTISKVAGWHFGRSQKQPASNTYIIDILFASNHNIHKSSCGLCFWASDPLIERF